MSARRLALVFASAGLLAIGACMGGGDDSEYPVSPGGGAISIGGSQGGDPGTNGPDASVPPGPDGSTPLDGGGLPLDGGTPLDGGGLPFDSGARDAGSLTDAF